MLRELNKMEALNIRGGELSKPKKHKRLRIKFELEYESSPVARDTVVVRDTVAVCDTIR